MTQPKTEHKDEFFLTYLVFKDNEKMLGHSAVGISKKTQDGTFELIFRVGLFPTHQVQMEDFILDKTGREFYCKQFPITLEEQAIILQKINQDRRLMTDTPKNPENKNAQPSKLSIPGGKIYHRYFNNCKDYAISLIEYARKDYRSLSNTGISIPRWSGKLDRVCIEKRNDGICILHPQGTKGFYIEKLRQYISDREKKPSYLSNMAAHLKTYDRPTKIEAARKLLTLLQDSNAEIQFSKQELGALHNARLGKITRELKQMSFGELEALSPRKEGASKRSFYSAVIKKVGLFKKEQPEKDIESQNVDSTAKFKKNRG